MEQTKVVVEVGSNSKSGILRATAEKLLKVDFEKGIYEPEPFNVFYATDKIGRFVLAPVAGCCGIVISTESWLDPKWRGQSHISPLFHELKAATAKKLGYSAMMATVELRNLPELI